jgi:hypothetical protein
MDPITAIANFGAALLYYAAEVRRDMKPELRDQLDGWVMKDLAAIRKLLKLDYGD